MKIVIVAALALVAVAVAAPAEQVEILSYDVEHKPDGSYRFEFQTSDGNRRIEEGVLTEVTNEDGLPVKALLVKGSYVQFDEEGHPVVTNYVADQNGYEATGELIPQVAE